MITISATAQQVLTRSHSRYFAVESWRNGVLLASDVPVATAQEDSDRSLTVPERVVFNVPRRDRGTSWSPTTDDHPLAANGQRLHVKIGIGLGNDTTEWIQRGVFLIEESSTEANDTVNVTCVGLLALIQEARLVSPFQPTGTLATTLRGLVEPAITVNITNLADRAVPAGVNYDEDRLGAVLELLDAWAADGTVDPSGVLQVTPSDQSITPVLSITDGVGGTVSDVTGGSTREGAYNAVVARGTAPDGGQLQGIAYDNSGGPKTYGGPFSPLPVPYFFSSPLLTTQEQVNAAAQTVLARLRRNAARKFKVTMVPNPALQLGDALWITAVDYTGMASIESMTLPYHSDGGLQTLIVRAM